MSESLPWGVSADVDTVQVEGVREFLDEAVTRSEYCVFRVSRADFLTWAAALRLESFYLAENGESGLLCAWGTVPVPGSDGVTVSVNLLAHHPHKPAGTMSYSFQCKDDHRYRITRRHQRRCPQKEENA